MLLDDDAAGARVADVEHQVARHGQVAQVGGDDVQQAHARHDPGRVQQLQEQLVAGEVLAGMRQVLGADRAVAARAQLFQQHLEQPVPDPGLVEEPGVARVVGDEGEVLLQRAGFGGGGGERLVPGAGQQGGVEREGQGVGAAGRRVGREAGAGPVAGAVAVGLHSAGPAGLGEEVGQRHPAVGVHLDRLVAADLVHLVERRGVAADRVGQRAGVVRAEHAQGEGLRALGVLRADRLLPQVERETGQLLDVDRDVPELDAAVRHEGDEARLGHGARVRAVSVGTWRGKGCRSAGCGPGRLPECRRSGDSGVRTGSCSANPCTAPAW